MDDLGRNVSPRQRNTSSQIKNVWNVEADYISDVNVTLAQALFLFTKAFSLWGSWISMIYSTVKMWCMVCNIVLHSLVVSERKLVTELVQGLASRWLNVLPRGHTQTSLRGGMGVGGEGSSGSWVRHPQQTLLANWISASTKADVTLAASAAETPER